MFGPYNFYDHHFFGEAQLITSAAFKLFTNLKVKLLDLRGVVRMHKQREIVNATAVGQITTTAKMGTRKKRKKIDMHPT